MTLRPQWDFLILILLLIAVNIPFVAFFPLHDGMTIFAMFYHFYNEFFFNSQLAQWSSYDMYGLPSYFAQIVTLTPMSYLMIVVGKYLHITNVLIMYYIALLADQAIYITGLYLLSKAIYHHRLTQISICVIGILMCIPYFQPFFNFRIYYLVPLLLLCLLRFYRERNAMYFWLSGIIFLISLVGNLTYFAGVWLLIATLFLAGLILFNKDFSVMKLPFHVNRSNGSGVVAVVTLAIVLGIFFTHLTYGVSLVAPHRSASGTSTLTDFLNYGGTTEIGVWLQSLLMGQPKFLWGLNDLTIFAGWAIPACSLFAFFISTTIARSLWLILIALLGLSLGGYIASVLFHFPLMSYFRHLSLLFALINVIMLLTAGLTIDVFLSRWPKQRNIILGLCIIAIIPLLYFRVQIYQHIASLASIDKSLSSTFQTHQPEFIEQRQQQPSTQRQRNALDLVTRAALNGGRYTTDYGFIQYDPCNSPWRRDWATHGIAALESINHGLTEAIGGCRSPKIRLITDATILPQEQITSHLTMANQSILNTLQANPQQASSMISGLSTLLSTSILIPASSQTWPLIEKSNVIPGNVRVKKFNANHIEFVATIENSSGAWLFYADAYHPGWEAYVDGEKQNIANAYGAFKAIPLSQGPHYIQLNFFSPLQTPLSYVIFIVGFFTAAVMIYLMMTSLFIARIKD